MWVCEYIYMLLSLGLRKGNDREWKQSKHFSTESSAGPPLSLQRVVLIVNSADFYCNIANKISTGVNCVQTGSLSRGSVGFWLGGWETIGFSWSARETGEGTPVNFRIDVCRDVRTGSRLGSTRASSDAGRKVTFFAPLCSASSLSTVTASLLAWEPMQGKTNLTWNLACNQAFFFIYVNVGRERLIAGYLKLEQWQSSSRGNKTNGVNESTLYCLCNLKACQGQPQAYN